MILKDYNETYAHRMRDKDYVNAYLAACLAEGPEAFYVGLRRAVQAQEGGFTWLAAQTALGRESLYRALSPQGNPSFRTVLKVLRALGADDTILAHVGTGAEATPPQAAPARERRSAQGAKAVTPAPRKRAVRV